MAAIPQPKCPWRPSSVRCSLLGRRCRAQPVVAVIVPIHGAVCSSLLATTQQQPRAQANPPNETTTTSNMVADRWRTYKGFPLADTLRGSRLGPGQPVSPSVLGLPRCLDRTQRVAPHGTRAWVPRGFCQARHKRLADLHAFMVHGVCLLVSRARVAVNCCGFSLLSSPDIPRARTGRLVPCRLSAYCPSRCSPGVGADFTSFSPVLSLARRPKSPCSGRASSPC
jgi:hypothetical protein